MEEKIRTVFGDYEDTMKVRDKCLAIQNMLLGITILVVIVCGISYIFN